jgi:hypothetical protein
VLERVQKQQNSLRELGSVRLAELQLRGGQLRTGVSERVESIKERSQHIKELAREVKGAAELTAIEVKERVKANATLHAAEAAD